MRPPRRTTTTTSRRARRPAAPPAALCDRRDVLRLRRAAAPPRDLAVAARVRARRERRDRRLVRLGANPGPAQPQFAGWYVWTQIQDQLNANSPVTVPLVKGLKQDRAEQQLEDVGLRPVAQYRA